MHTIKAYFDTAARFVLGAVALIGMSACDNVIYDNEGDCSNHYLVHFKYDHNMKWADAFSNEVTSVRLYAFDKQGTLVWQKSESGAALAAAGYNMEVEVPAGDYTLLAWCGVDNGLSTEHFNIPDHKIGETKLEHLTCRMTRTSVTDQAGAHAESKESLLPLFHATKEVSWPSKDDYLVVRDTMSLIKDTNHIRIMLQHLSDQDVDVNDFVFTIDEANGFMAHDNSLLDDENITYRPWNKQNAQAGIDISQYPVHPWWGGYDPAPSAQDDVDTNDGAITKVQMAICDFTIARLMADRPTFLTIRRTDGDLVARLPLRDYALILKDAYHHKMSEQEYLDRQDDYALTLFLDRTHHWISTTIIINQWRVVLQDGDFCN